MEESEQNQQQINFDPISKIIDIEEKQKNIKERINLISSNLIELKNKQNSDLIEIKKQMEIFKNNLKETQNLSQIITQEISKFAKQEDIDILKKQIKMFEGIKWD